MWNIISFLEEERIVAKFDVLTVLLKFWAFWGMKLCWLVNSYISEEFFVSNFRFWAVFLDCLNLARKLLQNINNYRLMWYCIMEDSNNQKRSGLINHFVFHTPILLLIFEQNDEFSKKLVRYRGLFQLHNPAFPRNNKNNVLLWTLLNMIMSEQVGKRMVELMYDKAEARSVCIWFPL